MGEKISWTLNIQVVGGAHISEAATIEVEAYDIIHVDLPSGAADLEVEVQPGGAGQASFLLIRADQYEDDVADHSVSYTVGDEATVITLNAPHILIGSGAVSLLVDPPTSLHFSNSLTADVTIEILVGRDATP